MKHDEFCGLALLLGAIACSGTQSTNIDDATTGAANSASTVATSTGAGGTTHVGLSTSGAIGGSSLGATVSGGANNGGTFNVSASGGADTTGGVISTGGTNLVDSTSNYGGTSNSGGTTQMGASTGGLNAATGGAHIGGTAIGGTTGIASVTGGSGGVNNTGGVPAYTGGTLAGGASSGGVTGATGGMSTGDSNTGGETSGAGGADTGGETGTGGSPSAGGTTDAGGTNAGGVSSSNTSLQTTPTSLLQDCILLLHMDESSWNGTPTEVIDSSGNGNNGTSIDGATTGSLSKYGRAGMFDGNDHVSINDSPTLHGVGALSVSVWFYPTGLVGDMSPGLVAKRWGYLDRAEFSVFLSTDSDLHTALHVDIDTENNRFAASQQFDSNTWYHVAVVFDGSLPSEQRVSVYVNGQLDSVHFESSSVFTPYDSPVEVGRLRDGGESFTGAIDEVAIWKRALSQSEVVSIFTATTPLQ